MPVYEYRCKQCGHRFERIAKFNDPNPPCPRRPRPEKIKTVGSEEFVGEVEGAPCQGETAKLVSRSSFALKGGGWAADGYS